MLKTLWPYLKPYRLQLFLGPLFKFLEAIIETLIPVFIARIIDTGVKDGSREFIFSNALIMLGLIVLGLALAISCQTMSAICSQGFAFELRKALNRRILRMRPEDFSKYGAGTLINRIGNDVDLIALATALFIRLLSRYPFICIGSCAAAIFISPRLGVAMLLALPVSGLLLYFTMKLTLKIYKVLQKKLDFITDKIRDQISGSRVIRAFSSEKREERSFKEKNSELREAGVKSAMVAASMGPLTAFLFNLLCLYFLWRGNSMILGHSLGKGELIALISYLSQLVLSMLWIATLVMRVPSSVSAAGRVSALLNESREDERPQKAAADSIHYEETGIGEVDHDLLLRVNDLNFRYPSARRDALHGLSFSLKKSESLAVIGATGSGKSSFVKLLTGLIQAEDAEINKHIFYRGESYFEYGLKNVREKVSYIPQHSRLMEGTIESNLLLGNNRDISEDRHELWEALETAQAADFVREKGGLDAKVLKDGKNFSGGQKQRLSIARSLLRNFEILIIDDATSALDPLTEKNFRNALSEKYPGLTLILVSQRIRDAEKADAILLLDGGRVAGYGTHEKLLETSSIYREIAESQGRLHVR